MSNGVIVFDDYAIEGVKDAVSYFAEKYKLEVCLSDPTNSENTIAWILIEKG